MTTHQGAATNGAPQRTLRREIEFKGIGLHTGRETTLRFRPAPSDSGVRFVRSDLSSRPEIPVAPTSAKTNLSGLRRTILASGGAEVHTVEHVLSALTGLGIDNVLVELNGDEAPEPPDGSTRAFVALLREAGIVEQETPRRPITLTEPVALSDGPIQIVALPHDRLRLSFTLVYDNALIGTQHASFDVSPESYADEIAPARTFALFEEVEALRAAGLIKGGTEQNALVVKGDRLLDDQTLRFPDEFVRHKILDLLGDLSLLGRPLHAHVIAVRSGHAANVRFVQKLHDEVASPRNYEALVDAPQFDIQEIQRIMPHRYPLLLVDRILLLEPGRRVVGLKNVTINEPFFVGHFPGHPIMPGVLILEAMAQAGGVLLLHTVDDPSSKLMYFLGIDNARFRKPVLPGDQLIFELELLKVKGRVCRMQGRAYVRGQLAAEAEFMSTIVDR